MSLVVTEVTAAGKLHFLQATLDTHTKHDCTAVVPVAISFAFLV